MRRALVSSFFADVTQQSHSLRASGVISSHAVLAAGSEVRTFFKSAGTLCTTPGDMVLAIFALYSFIPNIAM